MWQSIIELMIASKSVYGSQLERPPFKGAGGGGSAGGNSEVFGSLNLFAIDQHQSQERWAAVQPTDQL